MGNRNATSAAAKPAAATSLPKRVTVLGATGSIGASTLDLVSRNPHAYKIVALTAQSNARKLAELAVTHGAEIAVIGDETRYGELREHLSGTGIEGGGRAWRAGGGGIGTRRLRDGRHRRRSRARADVCSSRPG